MKQSCQLERPSSHNFLHANRFPLDVKFGRGGYVLWSSSMVDRDAAN